MLHVNRCALTRQTHWYHSHVCVFIQSKVVGKKAEIRRKVPDERSSEVILVIFIGGHIDLKGVCHLPTNTHYIFPMIGSHCFHLSTQ